MKAGHGNPFADGIMTKYGPKIEEGYSKFGAQSFGFSQFGGAEMMADKYGLTREKMDAFGVASHKKAQAAREKLREEIVPLPVIDGDGKPTGEMHGDDEGVRDVKPEQMAKLK